MSDLRYCAYCDAFRERLRCEACGWTTYTLKEPPQSDLPQAWRASKPDVGNSQLTRDA